MDSSFGSQLMGGLYIAAAVIAVACLGLGILIGWLI